MLLFVVTSVVCIMSAASLATSTVLTVKSVTDVEQFLLPKVSDVLGGTLLVLDIDNTIYQAQQEGHANSFYEQVNDGIHPEDAYRVWEQAQEHCAVVPVEEIIAAWIHRQQTAAVAIIGLTSRDSALADATIRQLTSIGVDLSATAPVLPLGASGEDEEDAQYDALRRMYISGVLYASIYKDKGAVLAEFLHHQPMRYHNVVMVDDLKKNLRSVDDAMHRAQIPFVGAHYPLVATTQHTAAHPNSEL